MAIKINQKENLTLLGLLTLVLLSGIVLALPKATADDGTTSNVAIRVNSACSVAVSPEGSNDTPHTADLNPGTYQANIGKTTIKTICNDSNGFSIYAIGYTNEEYGNTTLRPSTLDPTQNSIITGTATSAGTPDTSNWAMKISPVTGTYAPTIGEDADGSFSNYHKVPSAFTKVATRTSGTDITTGSSIEITYAAYIAGTQPADLYNGKVKFTMVHPSTEPAPYTGETTESGKICYYSGVTDSEGTMGCQDAREMDWSSCVNGTDYDSYCYVEGWYSIDIDTLPRLDSYKTSQTFFASNFSRNGYGFAGWSDSFDYATNPNAKFYGPQETVTFSEDTLASGLSLYAVWIKSEGSIQDQSKVASVCSSLTTAPTDGTANLTSVSALTDQRDNNTYAIAKLADGKCWMIENLRLESTADHNSDGTLAQGYGTSATYGNFGGLAGAESSNFEDSTTANSLYYSGTQEGTASIDIDTSDLPAYRMPRYNNLNTSTRASNPTNNSGNMYSYGNYYTWHAAIADLTYNNTNNQSTTGTSLCPVGWHLPTGGRAYASDSTGDVNVTGNTSTFREFYNLGYKTMDEVKTAYEDAPNSGFAYYSSNTVNTAGKTAGAAIRSFPNNFLYSGTFDSSSARFRGSYGYYWSSTASNSIGSHHLYLDSSSVCPGTFSYDKNIGLSIRCAVGT